MAIEINRFEQLEDIRAAPFDRRISGSVGADDDALHSASCKLLDGLPNCNSGYSG
jgi:hypothetical protein